MLSTFQPVGEDINDPRNCPAAAVVGSPGLIRLINIDSLSSYIPPITTTQSTHTKTEFIHFIFLRKNPKMYPRMSSLDANY